MTELKVQYEITTYQGKTSMLTLNKLVADELHAMLDDVHEWLQTQYDITVSEWREKGIHLTRKAIGNIIRGNAIKLILG